MPRRTKRTDTHQSKLGRRGFLKAATLAGTGAIAGAGVVDQAIAKPDTSAANPPAPEPKGPARHPVQLTSRESEQGTPPHFEGPSQCPR